MQRIIKPEKIREVEDIKRLVRENNVVAVVNMQNLPARQLIKIKNKIRNQVLIKYTKKRLIKIAFDQIKNEKKDIDKLKEKLIGVPALLFTKQNAFMLQKLLNKNKSNTAAKPGQFAPYDLTIPAGPTPFAPGPMIGELGVLGIKSKVQEGKIHVISDTVLVKKGAEINAKAAELLAKLGIQPMEIGLNLVAAYSEGLIFEREVLDVDEKAYLEKIKRAVHDALALATSIAYPTKETIEILIKKAYVQAKKLGEKAKILTPEKV